MSILYRNGAQLFETGADLLPNTQFVCTFQPRKPLNPGAANGGFKADESGNNFDLALATGTDARIAPGPIPGTWSAYLEGPTTFTRAHEAALAITGDVTVEMLVKPSGFHVGSDAYLMSFAGNGETEALNYLYSIIVGDGTNQLKSFHENSAGVNNAVDFDAYITPDEWSYIAYVRTVADKTLRIYINGVEVDSQTYANDPTGGTSAALWIGRDAANVSPWDGGWLAGLRIMDVARTADGIADTWDRINPDSPENLRRPEPIPEISPATHANVTLWHEAPEHDADDGDSVQTPTLLAGANGISQATVGERPLIYTSGGAPGWKMFDGTSTRWFDGAALSNYIGGSAYHVFVAFTMHSADQDSASVWQNHRILGDDIGWWGMYARRFGQNDFQIYGFHWDGAAKVTPVTVSRHEIHLAEFWYDTGTLETVLKIDDGAEVRVAAGNISTLTNPLEVGGNPGDDFQGVIHSLMIANGFDAVRRTGIRNYFANKYLVRV